MNIRKCKNLIKTFDLFSQPVTLRYSNQTQYQSLTGGICSIIIIIVFIAVFMGTLINTLNKKYISSTIKRYQQIQPSYTKINTSQFLFAIGISGLNMNQGQRWFDIQFLYRQYKNRTKLKKPIILQKCSKQQWEYINQNLTNIYDRLKLQQWLCPPQNLILELQGKYSSSMFKFYKVAIKQCNNSLSLQRPCVSPTKMQQYLNYYQSFTFNFYFLNTVLNPDDHQFVTQYLQDFNYFPFNTKTVTNANLYISQYSIYSDQSISPFEQNQQKFGGIVLSNAQAMSYQSRQKQYMKFFIRKSSQSIKIQRSYRKIDDTLSYIGGLFSAILSVLIILGIYNTYCYQLQIAKNLYKFNKDQQLYTNKFNLFIFIGYLLWLGMFKIGYIIDWKIMKNYHKCLLQVRKQMDIRLIFKKLLYSQKIAQTILQKHQLKLIHLQQPLTLQEIQVLREDYKNYGKLNKYLYQINEERDRKGMERDNKSTNIMITAESNYSEQNKQKNKSISDRFVNNHYYLNPNVEQFIVNQSSIGNFSQKSKEQNKQNNNGIFTIANSMIIDKIKQNQNKTNKKIQVQDAKQAQQLRQLIKQFKQYVNTIKFQVSQGGQISQKILNRIDHKILKKLTQQEQKQASQKSKQNISKKSYQQQKLIQSYQSQIPKQSKQSNIFNNFQQAPSIKISRPPILKKQIKLVSYQNQKQSRTKIQETMNKTMGQLGFRSRKTQHTYKRQPKSIEDLEETSQIDI